MTLRKLAGWGILVGLCALVLILIYAIGGSDAVKFFLTVVGGVGAFFGVIFLLYYAIYLIRS